jgi:hypothetical protein
MPSGACTSPNAKKSAIKVGPGYKKAVLHMSEVAGGDEMFLAKADF